MIPKIYSASTPAAAAAPACLMAPEASRLQAARAAAAPLGAVGMGSWRCRAPAWPSAVGAAAPGACELILSCQLLLSGRAACTAALAALPGAAGPPATWLLVCRAAAAAALLAFRACLQRMLSSICMHSASDRPQLWAIGYESVSHDLEVAGALPYGFGSNACCCEHNLSVRQPTCLLSWRARLASSSSAAHGPPQRLAASCMLGTCGDWGGCHCALITSTIFRCFNRHGRGQVW